MNKSTIVGQEPTVLIESIAGLIERVTYYNEETGFVVLKVAIKGFRELVTIIGSAASANPGEWITAEGSWIYDREHGRQFKARLLQCVAPSSREGIEKYLGSGLVKGIGPTYSKKLVAHFGENIFDIIDNYSARLEEVDGIGPQRRRKIKEAWQEQKIVRNIMLFLHSNGVSTSKALRIYRQYGESAIEKVRENPYILARDIHGIGFKSADQIALKMGVPRTALVRASAGIEHTLMTATEDGHCALPLHVVKKEAFRLLEIDEKIISEALARLISHGDVFPETLNGLDCIFLPYLKRAEEQVARSIIRICQSPAMYPPIEIEKAVAWCQGKTGKELSSSQHAAIRKALQSRILILTGGPGVGKTTLLHALMLILKAKKVQILLCAPTGRAAKRLSEATGMTAKTIHRLLESGGGPSLFARNEGNPLDCDLLVVDECSMVDVPLMGHLLRALPPRAHLLLVGDVDQLPSVGPGMVLNDLIQCRKVPVAALTEVFRQAASSRIITTAHRVNEGFLPEPNPPGEISDFYFIERDEPETILETMLQMIKDRIPDRFHFDPIRDIQVLAPMNRGLLGIRELNVRLQNELNPPRQGSEEVEKYGWRYRKGDKVIQIQNNYDKDVFNGDIGLITQIIPEDRELRVSFDGKEVAYDYGELDELVLAYAITIHKSQGSEFPVVVMPLAMQHYMLLQRNLVYTGLTRGKKLVVLVGQRKALAAAIRNNQIKERFSGLLTRLTSANKND